jgi:hypothetical protein
MVRNMVLGYDDDGDKTIFCDPETVKRKALSLQSIQLEASTRGDIYYIKEDKADKPN